MNWKLFLLVLVACLFGWTIRGWYDVKHNKFQKKLVQQCNEARRNMEIKFSEDVQKYEQKIAELEARR